jgi:hypothetical protein
MNKHYQPPLLLHLYASKRLINVLGFIHVLALAASVLNSLPVLIKCGLFIVIGSHFYCQRQRLKNQQYTIKHTESLGWELAENGEFAVVQILPSTVSSIFAIFLHLKKDNKPMQTVLIVSDALAEDDYRRLIVMLKTNGITKTSIN